MTAVACGALLVLAWQGAASTAGAQVPGPRTTIDWQAGGSCPDGAALRAQLEQRLGRPLSATARHEIEVHGSVSTGDSGGATLTLTTKIDGQIGSRELQATDCNALTQAAALILALSIDPELPSAGAAGASMRDKPALPPERPATHDPVCRWTLSQCGPRVISPPQACTQGDDGGCMH